MTTSCQFLSIERQTHIAPYEMSRRSVVGYAATYGDGLTTGMHKHPKAQLLYAVRGTMRVDVMGSAVTVPPTTALFIPADLAHSVRMKGEVSQRQLFIAGTVDEIVTGKIRVISVSSLLREVVIALCAEGADWVDQKRANHLAAIAMDEVRCAKVLPFALPMPRDPRLCRITSAILSSLNDRRALIEWSKIAGASERTLARLFVSETGMTFMQWRQQARLIEAYVSLSLGIKPAVAAGATGYASTPAFGAAFRTFFGCTPGAVAVTSANRPVAT